MKSPAGGIPAPAGVGDVLRLAWPSVLSFVCNSAYRVNDQYWVQGLGPAAHSALGATTFVLVLNFAVFFVGAAGSLSLVARATGSGRVREREAVVRHALALAAVVGVGLAVVGAWLAPSLPHWLGLTGEPASLAAEYLGTIYVYCLPLALAPVVDTIFIGMGNTRVPLLLQGTAVALNFVLNPCLIYGLGPFEARGIEGAALATCLSRAVSAGMGLVLLRTAFDVRWARESTLSARRLLDILRVGVPSALSIAIYAGVYLVMMRLVISPLGADVVGGLAIGFNAFEGVSFPFYLGVAVAGSSIVGRNLGAGDPAAAWQAVRTIRRIGHVLGLAFLAVFLLFGPALVPLFTDDVGIDREALLYLRILALSQVFVAAEAMNEKVLLGAGHTLPIFCISVPGNVLRVPLSWLFATVLGHGAAGVWWAINVTTLLKAAALWWMVERRTWQAAPAASAPRAS